MLHSGEGRKLFLQRLNLRPQYPLAALNGLSDSTRKRLAQALPLGLQINEGNRISHAFAPSDSAAAIIPRASLANHAM
nr:hypothetical protein Hi04_10k_c4983_00003 [uncultured bacterium]